jgi:hypothetical protein
MTKKKFIRPEDAILDTKLEAKTKKTTLRRPQTWLLYLLEHLEHPGAEISRGFHAWQVSMVSAKGRCINGRHGSQTRVFRDEYDTFVFPEF